MTDDTRRQRLEWLRAVASAALALSRERETSLALQVSAELDQRLRTLGVTQRQFAGSRRSLSRALKGRNLMLHTVAALADALGCDVELRFRPRGRSGTTTTTDGASACEPAGSDAILSKETIA